MNSIQSSTANRGMYRKIFWLVALAFLSGPLAVHGESQEGATDAAGEGVEPEIADLRTLIEIPEKARQILQEDMLDHLAVLNEINRYLSENDLRAAAEVAETGMGRSLLSKYQDKDIRPGRYMPKEMREIGWELHAAASEFAQAARGGDMNKTLLAYHRITSSCVACHYSYRTR